MFYGSKKVWWVQTVFGVQLNCESPKNKFGVQQKEVWGSKTLCHVVKKCVVVMYPKYPSNTSGGVRNGAYHPEFLILDSGKLLIFSILICLKNKAKENKQQRINKITYQTKTKIIQK